MKVDWKEIQEMAEEWERTGVFPDIRQKLYAKWAAVTPLTPVKQRSKSAARLRNGRFA